MKIRLVEWWHLPTFIGKGETLMVKLPNTDLSTTASELGNLAAELTIIGAVPPFDHANLAYTFRCCSTSRDQIPLSIPIYAPVAPWCPREAIHALKGAGFQHYIFPFQDPWPPFYHRWWDLMEDRIVHVAGGDPQEEKWTWSEEVME